VVLGHGDPIHARAHYDPAKMPTPAYHEGELANKPIFQSIDNKGAYAGGEISFANTSPEEHKQVTAAYYAMIEQADTAVATCCRCSKKPGRRRTPV
jgi:hypothetical protein